MSTEPTSEPQLPPAPPYQYAPAPQYGYFYPIAPPRRTNSMAIVALVMLFVFAPLAIVFGVIAKNQIRATGEDGEGFAKAGIIGGIVLSVLFVLMIILAIVMFTQFAHTVDDLNRNRPLPN